MRMERVVKAFTQISNVFGFHLDTPVSYIDIYLYIIPDSFLPWLYLITVALPSPLSDAVGDRVFVKDYILFIVHRISEIF